MDDIGIVIEDGTVVTRYPYRQMRATGICFRLPLSAEMKAFEAKLVKAAGVTGPDQHTTYEINRGNRSVFVMFSGTEVTFGTSISPW